MLGTVADPTEVWLNFQEEWLSRVDPVNSGCEPPGVQTPPAPCPRSDPYCNSGKWPAVPRNSLRPPAGPGPRSVRRARGHPARERDSTARAPAPERSLQRIQSGDISVANRSRRKFDIPFVNCAGLCEFGGFLLSQGDSGSGNQKGCYQNNGGKCSILHNSERNSDGLCWGLSRIQQRSG